MKNIQEVAEYATEALKKLGADMAQCKASTGRIKEFNIDGGEISLIRTLLKNNVSLKAVKDGKKGTVSINKFSKDEIDRAAKVCIESAEAGVYDEAVSIAEFTENREFNTGAQAEDADRLYDRIDEYLKTVKKDYPKIILEQVVAEYSEGTAVLVNTNGVCQKTRHSGYYLSTMFSAHEGEKSTSFNSCSIQFDNLEKPLIDIGMQRTLYEQSQKQLEAEKFTGKFTGKILLTPISLRGFAAMALGNFISDTSIIDGTSPWKNSLGKKVADSKLNIAINPLDKRMSGGERITSDGYISENCDIIKDGILMDFGLSEYAAKKTRNKRGKNTSSCMVISPGEKSIEEIISGIDEGLMVCRFSGGQPAVNGDFSGVAKNSFLIKNGKITHAVTETMISGNLATMFNNITAISKETSEDGSSSLPYALFDGITVSG